MIKTMVALLVAAGIVVTAGVGLPEQSGRAFAQTRSQDELAAPAPSDGAETGTCRDGSKQAVLTDVPYAFGPASDGARQSLDLMYDCVCRRPLVVFVHGGGWRRGDKQVGRSLRARMFNAGFAFASVNYRLVPQVSVAESAEDVADAIGYLVDWADDYNIDPDNVVVMGHSAGAHLAALVALDEDLHQALGVPTESLKGVVLLDGAAYDVAGLVTHRRGLSRVFGRTRDEQAAVSPVEHVDAESAGIPFLITVRDNFGPGQTQALLTEFEAAGQKATHRAYSGKRHGDFLQDFRKPKSEIVDDVLAFLQPVLRRSGAPACH